MIGFLTVLFPRLLDEIEKKDKIKDERLIDLVLERTVNTREANRC